jgi:hypothetical protein
MSDSQTVESQPSPARRHNVSLHYPLATLFISGISLAAAYIGPTQHACAAFLAAVLAAFITVVLAVRAIAHGGVVHRHPQRVVGAWVAVLGFLLAGSIVLAGLAASRQFGKSAVSAANLKGIAAAVRAYCGEQEGYPDSLLALVDAGLCTTKQLFCGYDSISEGQVAELRYSSYFYVPGVGPWTAENDVVLTYERVPWSLGGDRWYESGRGYQLLFGDGGVRFVPRDEMAAVLLRDRERRLELGWPVGP